MTKYEQLQNNIDTLPEPFKETCTILLKGCCLNELKYYIMGVFECIDNDVNKIDKNNARNIMRLLL